MRELSRRKRRLTLLGLLLAGAVALRGSGGGLLAVVALLVAVDAVVPMPGVTYAEAEDHFGRLVRARRRARVWRRLRGRAPDVLEVLDDREGWALTAARRPLGVQPIAIASITGTVEDVKARTFDRELRPDRASAEHWKRLWMAQAHGAGVPPISVYRVGGRHILRDGHHRASVARELGLGTIDAEVVELVPQCGVSSRSPGGPSSRARGTRPPAPRSAPRTATAAPSPAPAPPRRPR
jgi:hypothetical protein